MAYQVRTTPQFDKQVKALDSVTARRVVGELALLETLDDPRSRGRALTGSLRTYWRYRVGDYRIIVDIQDAELVVLALTVRHRSQAYR